MYKEKVYPLGSKLIQEYPRQHIGIKFISKTLLKFLGLQVATFLYTNPFVMATIVGQRVGSIGYGLMGGLPSSFPLIHFNQHTNLPIQV